MTHRLSRNFLAKMQSRPDCPLHWTVLDANGKSFVFRFCFVRRFHHIIIRPFHRLVVKSHFYAAGLGDQNAKVNKLGAAHRYLHRVKCI